MTTELETILLVEDNPIDAEAVQRYLRRLYHVAVARAADTALELLDAGLKPVCVLLDHQLPGRDGLSMLPALISRGLPVVMLSHTGREDYIADAIRKGALGYCHKDNLNRELLEVSIKVAIERHRADEFFRLAMNATPSGMILTRQDGTILFANRGAERIFGYRGGSLTELTVFDLFDTDPIDPVGPDDPDSTSRGRAGSGQVHRGFHRRGKQLYIELGLVEVENYRGEPCVLSTVTNVTEQIKLESRERATQARLFHLMDMLPVSVFAFDGSGKSIYTNANARALGSRVTASNRAQWKTVESHFCDPETKTPLAPEDRPLARALRGETIESQNVVIRSKYEALQANVTASPLFGRDGSLGHVVVVLRDTTETYRMEQELRQAQKMEAVGHLAGGIAHDFNNLLTAILSFGRFALEALEPDAPAYSDTQEIIEAAERARDLAQQLLAFSRQQPVNPSALDLNKSVTRTLKMLERIVGEDVELSWDAFPKLWTCQIDEGMFEQVLVNLVLNARDATKGGGVVHIRTRNTRITQDHVARQFALSIPAGDYVCLSVKDAGMGIRPEILEHIFEPFFTTKEGTSQSGTGLGLATCYGIITQAMGFIQPTSEWGVGTTFDVYLPRVEGKATEAKPLQRRNALGGREKILVVEDNDQIRRITARILKKLGYDVVVAENGVHALELLSTTDFSPSLLLTDTIMPKMGGVELVKRMASSHPNVKVLFMSGYTQDELGRGGEVTQGVSLLQKPFSTSDMDEKIREVLDGNGGRICNVTRELEATSSSNQRAKR